MSLLLLFGGGGGAPPISTGNILAIVTPDEIGTGTTVRVWAEGIDNSGNVPLDASPQITIWSLNNSGVRTTDVSLVAMTGVGEAYYYDWTPTSEGTYVIQVAGEIAAASVFSAEPVSVRPKFDPIALAVDDVLVSRM